MAIGIKVKFNEGLPLIESKIIALFLHKKENNQLF
jgi:hypothetical protein